MLEIVVDERLEQIVLRGEVPVDGALEMSSTSAIAPWLSFPMPLSRMMLLDASRIRCLLCSPFVAM